MTPEAAKSRREITPEQWDRVREIVYAALEKQPADRAEYLKKVCVGDSALRAEVESLISWSDSSDSALPSDFLARHLMPGTQIEHFEIVSLLGAGGMGEVYRARDTRLAREVAIKVLPAFFSADASRLRRFQQEATAGAALNHPNILAVFQMGIHQGAPYIVSELLEGATLREQVARGPTPVRNAIDYSVQIARGLAAAHEKGIAHRDLKPENLFLTKDGQVKILDFGLAKLMQPPSTPARAPVNVATDPGVVMGTVGYMSPEQARGQQADQRADIFALGAILYEILTGKKAFHKPTPAETMSAILNEDPPRILQIVPSTPLALQRVVHRCLEKNPEQRFQSASDLAFALEALSDSDTSAAIRLERTRLRIPWLWIATLGFTVMVAGGLIAWLKSPSQPRVESVRQLTDDGEVKEELAAIDTDGSRVYFTETYAGNLRLAQVSVSGGQIAPVSTEIPAVYSATMAPDFSGLLVVANSVRGSHPLWFQPLPAGQSRRLGDFDSLGAVFNPQNGQIVYVNGSGLYTAERDGASVHKICDLPGIGYMPAVSPDGKKVRVTVLNGLSYSLWEVGFTGKDLHPLGSLGSASSNVGFGKWTKDGRYFVFQSARGAGTSIWAISEKPGFLRSSSSTQLTNGPLSCSQPTPSYDGKQIFARCAKLRDELVRYDRNSQAFVPFLGGISAIDVTYSPDGKWVVYVSYPDRALWRMRANGTDRLQLVYSPMTAWYPHISPDSTRVVFFGGPWRSRMHSIYIVSLAGGEPEKIIDQGFLPDWSPDGNSIAFGSLRAGTDAHASENLELRVLDLKSGKFSVIPHSQGKSAPVWISQNTLVAGLDAGRKLVRYDFTTQTWSDLADGPFSDWTSSGGKYVYCTTYDPAPPAVLRIRLSDGRREPLANLTRLRRISVPGAKEFSLTPNGDLLFERDIGTDEIYALDVKWP